MTTGDVPHHSRSAVLRVSAVIRESADSRSLVFDIPDELHDRFTYQPGQFLTLRIPSELTGSIARCYSLASSPFTDDHPKITVKRTAGGYASNWLCDNVQAGDHLEVLPPAGAFTPENLDDDLMLFAAGSGITPVISILGSALARGSGRIVLIYANRNQNSVIFATELRELADKHPQRFVVVHWLEHLQGLPSADALVSLARPYSEYHAFMCGPRPFMECVHDALGQLGVPRNRTRTEVFDSLSGNPFSDIAPVAVSDEEAVDAATVEVELDGEIHTLRWPYRRTLVDILLDEGIDVPYSCRAGECGSCACTVLEGRVEMDNAEILDPEDIAHGYILGCQAHPMTDHLKIQF